MRNYGSVSISIKTACHKNYKNLILDLSHQYVKVAEGGWIQESLWSSPGSQVTDELQVQGETLSHKTKLSSGVSKKDR